MTLKLLSSYAPVDEEFDKVSLLLHGDGANGSTTIVDSSSSPKAVTAVGDAQISTAQSKFGGSSIAFDGTGDYLSTPNSTAFQLGLSGDPFTVEFWFYLNSSGNYVLFSKNGGDSSWALNTGYQYAALVFGGIIYWQWRSNSGLTQITSTSPVIQQWHHFALSYDGSITRLFVNGVSVGTPVSSNYVAPTSANNVYVGSGANADPLHFDGYIDDLRITKGVARYTSNFTPPAAPFPDLSPSGRVTIEDNSLDVDARQYIINVEEQDGQPLESGVRTGINDFVVGCKADGIWNAIKASCILAGARTLAGALVPLTGGAPTNNNFVAGDYNRKTGLTGNGSDKHIDSERANNADPQNSNHNAVFSTLGIPAMGSLTNNLIFSNNQRSRVTSSQALNLQVGFSAINRNASAAFQSRTGENTQTFNSTSATPDTSNVTIFRRNNPASPLASNATISFYSIGESLDLALLDTRVGNLMTAIGAAIP